MYLSPFPALIPFSGPVAVHAEFIDGLRALGLADATAADVTTALGVCYPSGHVGIDEGEVLRALWRHLRRDNVER